MNNFGIYYQSAFNDLACDKALSTLRQVYSSIPIVLFDDGSNTLNDIANKYGCSYKYDGTRLGRTGSNINSLQSLYAFFNRLYFSCIEELSECEYVMLYEDDVLCLRQITQWPIYDIAGNARGLYNPLLQQYLQNYLGLSKPEFVARHFGHIDGTLYGYTIKGGGIFNRVKFLECYHNINSIDWTKISKLDINIVKYANIALCFLFQINGFSAGLWPEVSEYKVDVSYNSAFLHGYKKYYG